MNAHLSFLLCALLAQSAAAATNGIYYLLNYPAEWTTPMTCGNTADADDLWETDQNDNSCGWVEKPCLAGLEGVVNETSDGCRACYALTFRQSVDGDASCVGAECPAYERTIMVKIEGGLGNGVFERMFDVNYLGWIELCPFVCNIDGPCVESADQCTTVVGDELDSPGSAQNLVPMSETAWQLVNCDDGSHLAGDGNAGGDFLVGTIRDPPSTTTTTTEEPTTTADGGTNEEFATGSTEEMTTETTEGGGAKEWGSRIFVVATFASLLAV